MVSDRLHQFIGLGGQQGAAFDDLPFPLPPLPEAGEREGAMLGEVEVMPLLEELHGRQQAATRFEGAAVGWFLVDRLAPGIERLALKRLGTGRLAGRIPPSRQQAPLGGDHLSLPLVVQTDDGDLMERVKPCQRQLHVIEIRPNAELVGKVSWRIPDALVVMAHRAPEAVGA